MFSLTGQEEQIGGFDLIFKGNAIKPPSNTMYSSMLGCLNNRSQQLKKLAKVTGLRLSQSVNLDEKETHLTRKKGPSFRIKDHDNQSVISASSGDSSLVGKKRSVGSGSRNNTMISQGSVSSALPRIQKTHGASNRPPLSSVTNPSKVATSTVDSKDPKFLRTKPRESSYSKVKTGPSANNTQPSMNSSVASGPYNSGQGAARGSKIGDATYTSNLAKAGKEVLNPTMNRASASNATSAGSYNMLTEASYQKGKTGKSPMKEKVAVASIHMGDAGDSTHASYTANEQINKGGTSKTGATSAASAYKRNQAGYIDRNDETDQSPSYKGHGHQMSKQEIMIHKKMLDADDQPSEKDEEDEE